MQISETRLTGSEQIRAESLKSPGLFPPKDFDQMNLPALELPKTPALLQRIDAGVLYVTINRPAAKNAMNHQVVSDLIAVFDAAKIRDDLRAIVLRGAEGNFCAGGDIKDFVKVRTEKHPPGVDPVAQYNRRFGIMLEAFNSAPQATIAVAEGAVLGGGFGLACVSDIAIAHRDANFGLPETGLGVPPAQIAPFVVARVGISQARRLALCGARFNGAEAQRLGLVHFVVDDTAALEAKLAEVLKQVRRCAPRANAATKQIMLSLGSRPLHEVLDDAAAKFSAALTGPEAAEGTQAFVEKRLPKWAQV
jgi:isohexenylglutaconyl-CoA hydratase